MEDTAASERSIPQEVLELIERFEQNRDSYRSSEYNEAQVRLEFIDPFFKALGWDVYNEKSHAEAYKDVVHEDAVKIGGATKAPSDASHTWELSLLPIVPAAADNVL